MAQLISSLRPPINGTSTTTKLQWPKMVARQWYSPSHSSSSLSSTHSHPELGMPAKSTVKPPGPDYAPNPQRSANPFTTTTEPDWIRKSDLLALANSPPPPLPPQQNQEQIFPAATATPTPPALTQRPSKGAPRKLPPVFNPVDLPPLPARTNAFTISKPPPPAPSTTTASILNASARISLETSHSHPGKLAKPTPPTVPRKPVILSRDAQRAAALDIQVFGGGRQTHTPPPKRQSASPATGRPALPPRNKSWEMANRKGKGLMDDDEGGNIEWVPLRPA